MAPGEWIALLGIIIAAMLTLGGAGLAAYNRVTVSIAVIKTILMRHDKTMTRMERFLDTLSRRKGRQTQQDKEGHDSDEPNDTDSGSLGIEGSW